MLTTDNSVLVVVDVQEQLFQAIDLKNELAANLQKLIRGAQILSIPVLCSEQAPGKIGKTIPEIAQLLAGVPIIEKNSFSCWGEVRFIEALGALDRRQILIAGIETHVCVYQTAADLINAGYDVSVVADAVSSRMPQNKVIGLEKIKEAGGSVTSIETALCELLRRAEGEKFREILKLIK